ncbi:MAG: tetratricopeptide repeat protein [Armatimonadetes bacterium]|nr:tetratricopeptide repeat protein [Armatimonadota bacterium]
MATVQDNRQTSAAVEEQYEIGFAHRCKGEYDLASKALTQVLELDPSHMKARWQLALIKGFEGDFEGSLEGLRDVAQEAPDNTDVRYDYAMTLMMLGHSEDACQEFHEVLRLDPDHEKAKQQLTFCE